MREAQHAGGGMPVNRSVLRPQRTEEPHVVVFAGAGASVAVSPEYPTTEGFFKTLPSSIATDPLFSRVHQFLTEKQGLKAVDIENILWRVHEIRSACEQLGDQS